MIEKTEIAIRKYVIILFLKEIFAVSFIFFTSGVWLKIFINNFFSVGGKTSSVAMVCTTSCVVSWGNWNFPGFGLLPNKEALMSVVVNNDDLNL